VFGECYFWIMLDDESHTEEGGGGEGGGGGGPRRLTFAYPRRGLAVYAITEEKRGEKRGRKKGGGVVPVVTAFKVYVSCGLSWMGREGKGKEKKTRH